MSTTTATGIVTDVLSEIAPYEESNDPDRHTHIVRAVDNGYPPGFPSQSVVDLARISQSPVTALCGYTWVPKHDPDKYPACEPCFVVAGQLMQPPSSN